MPLGTFEDDVAGLSTTSGAVDPFYIPFGASGEAPQYSSFDVLTHNSRRAYKAIYENPAHGPDKETGTGIWDATARTLTRDVKTSSAGGTTPVDWSGHNLLIFIGADTEMLTSMDSMVDGTNNKVFTAANQAKLAALDAALVLVGTWDASGGAFPGLGVAQAGYVYIVSVAGTVDGQSFAVGDRLTAIVDNASTTVFAANWFKEDYTDQVLSVGGNTGVVTDAHIETSYNNQVSVVSQAEAEAGTATTVRRWTALRVRQAIEAVTNLISTALSNHLSDATDAHDASAISSDSSATGLEAENVDDALAELNSKKRPNGGLWWKVPRQGIVHLCYGDSNAKDQWAALWPGTAPLTAHPRVHSFQMPTAAAEFDETACEWVMAVDPSYTVRTAQIADAAAENKPFIGIPGGDMATVGWYQACQYADNNDCDVWLINLSMPGCTSTYYNPGQPGYDMLAYIIPLALAAITDTTFDHDYIDSIYTTIGNNDIISGVTPVQFADNMEAQFLQMSDYTAMDGFFKRFQHVWLHGETPRSDAYMDSGWQGLKILQSRNINTPITIVSSLGRKTVAPLDLYHYAREDNERHGRQNAFIAQSAMPNGGPLYDAAPERGYYFSQVASGGDAFSFKTRVAYTSGKLFKLFNDAVSRFNVDWQWRLTTDALTLNGIRGTGTGGAYTANPGPAIEVTDTKVHDYASAAIPSCVRDSTVHTVKQSGGFLFSNPFLDVVPTIKNDSSIGSLALPGLYGLNFFPTFLTDSQTTSLNGATVGLNDIPVFARAVAGSGTLNHVVGHIGMNSLPSVGAGVTLAQRIGVQIQNHTGVSSLLGTITAAAAFVSKLTSAAGTAMAHLVFGSSLPSAGAWGIYQTDTLPHRFNSGVCLPWVTKTTNYTVTTADYAVEYTTATGAPRTVMLYAVTAAMKGHEILLVNNSSFSITPAAFTGSGNSIDTTALVSGERRRLQSDGVGSWVTVG